jgi:N6-L-threonylcarbamoyladenine synthase
MKHLKNGRALILGIETSCDETAAAVTADGRDVLSNVIASQIGVHEVFGGVVPEIASRHHLTAVNGIVSEALRDAGVGADEIDAVAVTMGPGLVGAVLIGLATAKAMAFALGKPLLGIHHIRGHICAALLEHPELEPPFLALVVSGGHTSLVDVRGYGTAQGEMEALGSTRDDAAGEAFDKVARVLGLGYPGGPKVDALAKAGNPEAVSFKRALLDDGSLDFSFSGLKTGVLNYVNTRRQGQRTFGNNGILGSAGNTAADEPGGDVAYASACEPGRHEKSGGVDELGRQSCGAGELNAADIAAAFQQSVIDVLAAKTKAALTQTGRTNLALVGGVAANSALRCRMRTECESLGISLYIPSPVYCTDNAAMIACAGYYDFASGKRSGLDLDAHAALVL